MNEPKKLQAHLYIDKVLYPETARRCQELIVKRKLNNLMVRLLEEHFKKEPEQEDLFK